MIYVYLFEAKSIQKFLFNSGKLKDVISASERLDRLIDTSKNSILAQVLHSARLESDLFDANMANQPGLIRFLRCKGGAFYAYCEQPEPLQKLRSLWTLTVSQLFPSLTVTDALEQAETLIQAMDKGHKALAASRNAPQLSFPIAPAIAERYSRTGNASVPLGDLAKRATHAQESQDDSLDFETEKHRQAYQSFDLRDAAALQDRFTPESHIGEIYYPIDFEKEFDFDGSKESLIKSKREAIKDMALIHIDGNGLGLLLMALKTELSADDVDNYRNGFRTFSEALNVATEKAAKQSTQELLETIKPETRDNKGRFTLPMRPVVLGGDDVTLFCRADLALQYSRTFCKHFKLESEQALKPLFEHFLPKSTDLLPYITASGGVLFHKASHPFMQSHHLVEALCDQAKTLTKSIYGTGKVGPAALAMYRVSNATQLSFGEITETSSVHHRVEMGMQSYFVEEEAEEQTHKRNFGLLGKLCALSMEKDAPVSIAKWRQMATHIALDDMEEAKRIYHRCIEQCKNEQAKAQLSELLKRFVPEESTQKSTAPWCWTVEKENQYGEQESAQQTFINDLLIFAHYQPAKTVNLPDCRENI
ncbi:hypothetical protein D1115_06465 [Vibrio alfacsensis]|uniref:Cas10/Cmr2 second palm domain-containing protein n=1 Tax=Vibrio alfacsensis TaxID=1074311 RepID=A0ABM6YSW8_9VIBR|nr:hypothetical protein [Vibrio alfacsensis]AXY00922.1 hypothetical protein D1115_06465 [Vibrio alfacsensis]